MAGGDNHTIALTDKGEVWSWGINDEGQVGVGDTFGDYNREVREDPTKEQKNLNYIKFFKRPEKVDTLPEDFRATHVYAGKNYSYVHNSGCNSAYSWGFGENYVLGTRNDDSQFTPVKVDERMFFDAQVRHIGCGDQHIIALCAKDKDSKDDVPLLQLGQQQVAE